MFGRGKASTRFDPDNAAALCFGCHRWLDTHPDLKREFFRERLGDRAFDLLEIRANTPSRKLSLADVAALLGKASA